MKMSLPIGLCEIGWHPRLRKSRISSRYEKKRTSLCSDFRYLVVSDRERGEHQGNESGEQNRYGICFIKQEARWR